MISLFQRDLVVPLIALLLHNRANNTKRNIQIIPQVRKLWNLSKVVIAPNYLEHLKDVQQLAGLAKIYKGQSIATSKN